MGYAFTLDKPYDGVAVGCALNGHQMTNVRLVMIEVGTVAGDGYGPSPGKRSGTGRSRARVGGTSRGSAIRW